MKIRMIYPGIGDYNNIQIKRNKEEIGNGSQKGLECSNKIK